jgi:hypothetical protein
MQNSLSDSRNTYHMTEPVCNRGKREMLEGRSHSMTNDEACAALRIQGIAGYV